MRPLDARSFADKVGILGSTVCALHCVAGPAFLVIGAALHASLVADELFHRMLLGVILPAALFAFGLGCWHHKDRWVLVIGSLGLIGLSSPVVLSHDQMGEFGERLVTLASAAILIFAHVRNFRLCRADDCGHEQRS